MSYSAFHPQLLAIALLSTGLSMGATISSVTWGADPSSNGQIDWSAGNAGFTHAINFDSAVNTTFTSSDGYGLTGATTMTFYGVNALGAFTGTGGDGSLDATNDTTATGLGTIPGLTVDFYNRGDGAPNETATLTLTGLATNTTYELVLYQDNSFARGLIDFAFTNSGTGSSGGDTAADISRGGTKISVLYTTGDNTSVSLQASSNTGSNMHWFAFSNQTIPEPSSVILFGLGSLGLLLRRRR